MNERISHASRFENLTAVNFYLAFLPSFLFYIPKRDRQTNFEISDFIFNEFLDQIGIALFLNKTSGYQYFLNYVTR